MLNRYHGELFIINLIIFLLSRARASLLAVSHLYIQERALFVSIQKSSKLFQEIMTLVSSSSIMGTDNDLIEGGTSVI
jgi:hypothetical protein